MYRTKFRSFNNPVDFCYCYFCQYRKNDENDEPCDECTLIYNFENSQIPINFKNSGEESVLMNNMMILNEHTVNETPPIEKPLLMMIEKDDKYLWTVGYWDDCGWHCEYDKEGYDIAAWYKLPLNFER